MFEKDNFEYSGVLGFVLRVYVGKIMMVTIHLSYGFTFGEFMYCCIFFLEDTATLTEEIVLCAVQDFYGYFMYKVVGVSGMEVPSPTRFQDRHQTT